MRISLVPIVIITIVGASLLPGPATAAPQQESHQAAERSRFFGSVDVSVVNLEVFVSDSDGRPVTDLTIDDFELLVDGEPVAIQDLYTVTGNTTESAADTASEPLQGALPTEQQLYVVVVIDNSSIQITSRNRVIRHLEELMTNHFGGDDQVMLLTMSPGLKIRHSFNQPFSDLSDVLDTVASEIGGTGQFEVERKSIVSEIKRASAAPMQNQSGLGPIQNLQQDDQVLRAESILNRIRSYAQWRYDTIRLGYKRLIALLDSLSGLPGRKALLYVGEGSSVRVGQPLYEAWVQKYQQMWMSMSDPPMELARLNPHLEANRNNLRRELDSVARHANACRVTFYAIDAANEASSLQISAEHPGFSGTSFNESARLVQQQQSLQMLSSTTGGRHIANIANVPLAVETLRRDFESYYSLGFAPPAAMDGEYHRIKVKVVNRDGVRVRHRDGFRTSSLDDLMTNRLHAALALDVAPNPFGIEAAPVEANQTADGLQIRVLTRIPIEHLLLVPQGDEHLGRVTVWVAASDEQGRTSDAQGRRIPVRIPESELDLARQQDVGYTVDVMVGKGPQKVAIVVRDELAMTSSTITLEIDEETGSRLLEATQQASLIPVEPSASDF